MVLVDGEVSVSAWKHRKRMSGAREDEPMASSRSSSIDELFSPNTAHPLIQCSQERLSSFLGYGTCIFFLTAIGTRISSTYHIRQPWHKAQDRATELEHQRTYYTGSSPIHLSCCFVAVFCGDSNLAQSGKNVFIINLRTGALHRAAPKASSL